MRRRSRILLVYAVPFSGHAQAAFALRQALEKSHVFDVREFHFLQQWKTLGEAAVNFYKWMLKQAPEVWGHVHNNPDYTAFADFVVQGVQQWDVTGLLEQVKKEKPTAIIAFQSFPLRILAEAKKNGTLPIPLYVVTTDFWAHRYWAHPHVDHYFSSTARATKDLRTHGVIGSRITQTGIPLRQEFLETNILTRNDARKQLMLETRRNVVLVMGGSYGFFSFEDFYQIISHRPSLQKPQWLFLFGNDQEGLKRAEEFLLEHPLACIRVYGFRTDISCFMRASDVLISKAGGLSTSEALAIGLPLVLCNPLPGQEEKNVDFLVHAGAAVRAQRVETAIRRAIFLLNDSDKRRRLIRTEQKLAPIDAATRIVNWLAKNLP